GGAPVDEVGPEVGEAPRGAPVVGVDHAAEAAGHEAASMRAGAELGERAALVVRGGGFEPVCAVPGGAAVVGVAEAGGVADPRQERAAVGAIEGRGEQLAPFRKDNGP